MLSQVNLVTAPVTPAKYQCTRIAQPVMVPGKPYLWDRKVLLSLSPGERVVCRDTFPSGVSELASRRTAACTSSHISSSRSPTWRSCARRRSLTVVDSLLTICSSSRMRTCTPIGRTLSGTAPPTLRIAPKSSLGACCHGQQCRMYTQLLAGPPLSTRRCAES